MDSKKKGRALVPTGGPGSELHFPGLGRYIPPYMVVHGPPLYLPFQHATYQPFQHLPSQYTPAQYALSQHLPSQYTLSQYTPSQYALSQYVPSQYAPSQHPMLQYVPSQYTLSQYAPSQHPLSQYVPPQHLLFQHPNVSAAHLPWGYTYPAPLLTSVPHQGMMRLSGQAPPTQGSSTPAAEMPPVQVERKVMRGEREEGSTVVPTEAAPPGQCYPNHFISEGGKL